MTKLSMKKILVMVAVLTMLCFLGRQQEVMAKEVECNVKNEGVKGDGITDDAQAINKVLEKAALLAEGDTLVVYFPEGQYNIGTLLKVYSNTSLKLDNNAVIYRTNTMYPMIMNVGDDGTRKEESAEGGEYKLSSNIQVLGGTFDGGDVKNASTSANTINIAHAQNVIFDGVTVKNNKGAHLIELSGVKNAVIRNCSFSGLYAEKGNDTGVSVDTGLNGIGYIAKECIQLDYTYFDENDKAMQWCPDYYSDKTPCKDILIENNTFTDYPRGVGNHHGCDAFPGLYSSNITIRNNTFKDMYVTTADGKKLYEYAITLHSFANAVVENNTIENAGSAVLLAYDKDSVVKNNKINNLTSTAFVVTKDSKGSTITKNTVVDVPRYGISVSGDATVKAFTGNTLKIGTAKKKMINGITINGESGKATITAISKNKISDCSQFGISTLSVKNIKNIASNTFAKCEKAALCLSGTSCKNVKGNKITGCKDNNSIMIIKQSDIKTVQKNILTDNGKHGISIGGASKVGKITGNTIQNSISNGICIFEESKVTSIEKNKIVNSAIGISILNSSCDKVNSNTIQKSVNYGICATTAVVNYVENNTIDTVGKAGVLYCKSSKGKKVSGNTCKNIQVKDISIDSTSKVG